MTAFTRILRLSLPLCLVQFGFQLVSFVDTVLAGRIDQTAVAATGLGSSVFFAVSVVGIGVVLGLDPMISQALGAQTPDRAAALLRQGIWVSLLCGIPLVLAVVVIVEMLPRIGIAPVLANATADYVYGRLPSVWLLLLSVTFRAYLQAARITGLIVLSAVLTNVVNFAGDWLLIFGDAGLVAMGLPALGLPECGVFGIGVASTLATFVQACVLGWAVRRQLRGDFRLAFRLHWPMVRAVLLVGLPNGLQLLAEVGVFATVQLLMGILGAKAAAAHTVALMLAAQSFAVCLGIGAATSVEVGRAIGARDPVATRTAGFSGMAMGVAFMSMTAAILWTFPDELAGFMSTDLELLPLSKQLIFVAGAFQVVDGLQAVGSGALRGAGLTRFSFLAHLVSHWVFGLPLGIFLTFGLGLGPAGLWWGLTFGLSVAAFVLLWKFRTVSANAIQPL